MGVSLTVLCCSQSVPRAANESGAGKTTVVDKQRRKTAHNAIERRYRNSINDKIAEMRLRLPDFIVTGAAKVRPLFVLSFSTAPPLARSATSSGDRSRVAPLHLALTQAVSILCSSSGQVVPDEQVQGDPEGH